MGVAFIITIFKIGFVGIAGSFIFVPVMLVVLKIPTRMTIATSLAITFISSISLTVGKIGTNQVLYEASATMIIASVIAVPLGAKIGQKTNTNFCSGFWRFSFSIQRLKYGLIFCKMKLLKGYLFLLDTE